MNYLAHLYLADESPESLLGNLMGDFIKGSLDNRYSQEIKQGIITHRKVDAYTDSHPIVLSSKRLISVERRRFSGIIVDVCYDHFLATHWHHYSNVKLSHFIVKVYTYLQQYQKILPDKLQSVIPKMIEEDWLGSYQHITGIDAVFNRISKRLPKKNRLMGAVEELVLNYDNLENYFLTFFPDLIKATMTSKKKQ
jgi:acyl carrier protein phosphodiesterase